MTILHMNGLILATKVSDVLATLHLGDETLRRIMNLLLKEMEHGLSKEGTSKADIRMLPKIYRIPHEIMIGDGDSLFDHIASCLAQFMKNEGLEGEKLPLGFTFSFPCAQSGLTSGALISWTKGFKCSGVEGEDVVQLLAKACRKRQDVDIDVVALLNDTVGTLMALAYSDHDCQIGVIVGTGSNACYMERIARCPKLEDDEDLAGEMIINTEWGAFGDNGCLSFVRTKYDDECDRHSINRGKQLFEKMISGMYMGELVRLVLVDLVQKGLLFHGNGSEDLSTRGKFPTKYVSEIEADRLSEELSYSNTLNICEDLGIENVTVNDCMIISNVCSAVSTRAAYLSAVGIAVLLNRMQKPSVTVGVDGSVYRFHPTFRFLLQEKISHLIDPGLNCA
uniref:Phosphotransferase n=1 Tax=Romanomermis culicivorax TaxID=13658 RepID=A0A915HRN7_ROMCU